MRKQHGYYSLDFTGFFIFLFVIGALLGVFGCWFVPWVWGFIKPWLHAITA